MQTTSPLTFDGLGIAPVFRAQLDHLKFTTPTPIQAKAIPVALEGKDLIGIAQTGTGKTLAFGIPMIQRLATLPPAAQGLVVLPTRELAEQVEMHLRKIAPAIPLVVIIGGASAQRQVTTLRRNPKIIIATPGRLIDLMQSRHLTLKNVAVLVLDEADRMLDMGFAPQINKILAEVPKARQTLLFSATMPPEITQLATRHMQLPLRIEVAKSGTTNEKVTQELFVLSRDMKAQMLEKLLAEHRGTVLVFSRTKHGARKLTKLIREMGHTVEEIHANRTPSQRRGALAGFKTGRYRVLVATDIASRGIDVVGIELVVNYDLPDNPEDYVHRIGRTGRAGHAGKAISFAAPDQIKEVRSIERVIRASLPTTNTPQDLPPRRAMPRSTPDQERGRGFRSSPRRDFRSSARPGTRPSARTDARPGTRPGARPSARPSARPNTRPGTRPSGRYFGRR